MKQISVKKINSLKEVYSESTCQKRVTICEIYDKNDILLSRESNRCNPDGGICSRLGLIQNKSNYDVESSCNWIHAEVHAINNIPTGSMPYKSVLYGHDFYCDRCESILREAGIEVFLINKDDFKHH